MCGPRPVLLTGLLVFQNQLSGNLLRKFKNSNGWQKLWVVFTNFCLFFYKSHQVRASHRAGGPWDGTSRVQAGDSLRDPSRSRGRPPSSEEQGTLCLPCPAGMESSSQVLGGAAGGRTHEILEEVGG